eukprot:scaffold2159_cov424-Pavlova_lutheri.AAC.1
MFTSVIQGIPTQSIFVGNGEVVFAKESGNVEVAENVELQNVLLCPALKVNLVSVPKLMEHGCNIYFENDGCTVWKGKKKVLSAMLKHGLYIINSSHEQVFSAMEWHRKFAHFGQMEKFVEHARPWFRQDASPVGRLE